MDSIEPRAGPMAGGTRVTVRAAGIASLVDAYPEPQCKFGKNSMIVEANYIKCTKAPTDFYAKEKGYGAEDWNSTCIQCENSRRRTGRSRGYHISPCSQQGLGVRQRERLLQSV